MSVSNEQVVEALRTSVKEADRLRSQNKQLLARRSEPIAIIGIGCHFPGGIASARDLWEVVASDREVITEMPLDRGWDMDRVFDPDPEQLGTTYVRRGGFLHDVAEFDAAFFGIGPREALAMDPQQRLLLERTWEALEDAGIDPSGLRGSATGTFVGAVQPDYTAGGTTIEPGMEALLGTGISSSIASGRIAYTLGLEGPAVTLDTACSSSLVAIHLAMGALRSGDCELALAGGVTVHSTPGTFVGMSRQRALTPDGRVKSYDGNADGTALGEACGIVALERLSAAKANGRRVLAVIRGSATNQDGASNGLTAPSGPSQERVIRQALANAGLTAAEVDAVEGHGTGTALGDPIEAQALLATYGQDRDGAPLQLGSLKSNVGHTVAAAGVGGVIKMVMALREETLPKTLHVGEPTPHVDWSSGEVELLTEQREWKRGERPRRAGVSSFGISGTNAHLILEEAPEQPTPAEAERPSLIAWAVSAKTPEALREYAGRLTAHVEQTDADPLDVAHTLFASRASLAHRAVAIGADAAELLAGLEALAQGRAAANLVEAKVSHGKTAFLFSGQGSQRARMGVELYEAFPAYAGTFDAACEALAAELGTDVKAAVFAEEGTELAESLSRTDLTQASLFALEVALYELLVSFGAKADYLIGHSIGELAAAHVAGVLSLSDAAKLVATRGKLMAALPEGGAMASVRATAEEVEESLAPYAGKLGIAAVNAPASIVVSGDEDALAQWEAEQEKEGRKTKRLDVSHAFHSHRMEPMLAEFEALAKELTFNAPQIPIVSNRTGEELSEEQATSPSYWASHVREAVRFAEGIAWLRERGASRFLELGPDAILAAIAAECEADAEGIAFAATLRREYPEPSSFATALGALRASGGRADLSALCVGGSLVELPTYPFQRERFWLEPGIGSLDPASLGQAATEHPMLAASISLAREREQVFTGRVSAESHPWLADHVVAGAVIVPGTAFCELALRAGAELGIERLEEMVMEAPLLLAAEEAVQLQVSVAASEDDAGRLEFAIHSRPEPGGEGEDDEAPWTRHASGTLAAAQEVLTLGFDAMVWPPPGAEPVDVEAFYDLTEGAGFEYGPAFQGLESAWRLGGEIFGEISLAEDQRDEAERFGIHPALLDAALHPALIEAVGSEGGLRLPFSFSGVSLGTGRGASQLRVRVRIEDERVVLAAADFEGKPVCAIESLAMRPVEGFALEARPAASADLFQRAWEAVELATVTDEPEVEVHRLLPDAELDPAAAAHRLVAEALEAMQELLADESCSDGRLAFLSEGGISGGDGELSDPAVAAAWGLVRSAQSEHPGRFALLDSDGSEESERALAAALAGAEPELVLREGRASVPRLVPAVQPGLAPLALDPEGTVLVSGGFSALGALAACHLAQAHDARHLLLVGRRGPDSSGAEELIARLAELGAEATVVSCDVSDRDQVAALLAGVAAEHPLTAIVHCAGVLDDGTVESLDAERLGRVLAPKADGAWHLHELSAGLDLAAFVLYSSAAAAFGNPGQGNYAAANSFLDALAQRRHAEGLPATSIAWGMWEAGMAASLSEAERTRLGRTGLTLIDAERGAELFDRALALGDAAPVAVPLDRGALRTLDGANLLPPILAGLVPSARRRSKVAAGSLARRLAEVEEGEREALVLREVQEHVAAILGHASAESIDPQENFKDLGFDSLGAVELRNRLSQATGVRLEATLVFDHPNSAAIASYLVQQVGSGAGSQVVVRAAAGVDEPVAIIGIGCRFPGGASSPQGFWSLVAEGRDGISEFPADRGWDVERLYDPDPARAGKTYVREGGFIDDVADFDPAFFGIGPREALAMDPQQRLLLEGAWEALEDAGIDPVDLRGSSTGVYAGVMMADYAAGGAALSTAGLEGFGTGIAGSVASGRIAYTLGLEGPAVTIDTACSSSLVAMHLAAQALRSGECELALAGGATVLSTPAAFVEFSRQRVFAPDGRAKSFAASADGTSWGEGMGLILLERLSDAKANSRRILAVIRGSATNQDGASNGLTAPNGPSQERVIRQALANAGLKPAEVDAVEAHGTGTVLGDPIEAQALLATYGRERDGRPLALGSLKSNFGHTQAAAGVGGVIKMVMALREEALPKTLHLDEPTPHVDWESGEIELLTEQREWKRGKRPRRAGVSSFGISGTNAHVILEEAPQQQEAPEREAIEHPPAIPWAISAKTPEALREFAGRLAAYAEQAEPDPIDVAGTLLASRASLPHRAVAIGKDTEELLGGLDALSQGKDHPDLVRARAKARSKIAFLFPGQGSQWVGMAAELLDSSPVFAAAMAECEEALSPHLEWSMLDTVRNAEGAPSLDRIEVVQPALFAVMVSLAGLWRSFGVVPQATVGHSQGEIAAAVVAGALSLRDGARLAALRSQAIAKLVGKGAMVSVALSAEKAREQLAERGEDVTVAAVNGPNAVTVACGADALPSYLAKCEQDGIRAREVAATIPSHSHHVEALQAEVLEALGGIEPQEATAAFYSTVTAQPLDPTELTAPYWYRNLREPVQFEQATRALIEDGFTTFVEISSHPVLALALEETVEDAALAPDSVAVLHTLRRDEGGMRRFLLSLSQAHASGIAVDFGPLFGDSQPVHAELPTYPFQRERFWLEASVGGGDPSTLGQHPTEHPMLASSISLAKEGEHLFTGRLSQADHPWMTDHAVAGAVILPGSAFCEMALRAGSELGAETLQELIISAPLLLPEQESVRIHLSASASEADPERFAFAIHSQVEGRNDATDADERPWVLHASGALGAAEQPLALGFDPTAWPPAGAEPIATEDFYDRAAEAGIEYGPALQGLETAWERGGEIFAEVALAPEQQLEAERFLIHPALLDAALQAGLAGVDPTDFAGQARLPFAWSGVAVRSDARPRSLRVRVSANGESASIEAADTAGEPVCTIRGIHARPVDLSALQGGAGPDELFEVAWAEVELPKSADEKIEVHRIAAAAEGEDSAAAAHARAAATLELIQDFLADEGRADVRLAIVTEGASAAVEGESVDPAAAAVSGLVRSAQFEHPRRFALIDTDGSEASEAAILAAASAEAEPQLALRDGAARAPRLSALGAGSAEGPPEPWSPDGTVLITGGLSGLGALAARHLASQHGAKRLLLTSRRGAEAPGAAGLIAELAELGCEATAVACDVSDRVQLEALLAGIPDEQPLSAVVHCAGALDDALVASLDAARLDAVLTPKADAAWHLHELTRGMDLSAFVLYSSIAGVFGNPGQGNYAAANAFLDGLAQRRRAEGLPATSISWGLWEMTSEMTAHLQEEDRSRFGRLGLSELELEQGMELFDRACASPQPHQVAVPIEKSALRRLGRAGMLPALFSGLVPAARRRSRVASGVLARKLEGVPEAKRKAIVLSEVRGHVAAILGHASAEAIDPQENFKDLGFDSLGAVELRNRLSEATGVPLEATLVFDYPTSSAVASYLLGKIQPEGASGAIVRAARGSDEPVAIVGIGCRFPGGIASPQGFWDLVAAGGDGIVDFPTDRGWDVERLFDPDPERVGKTYVREGGFLDDVGDFDPAFFGISPKEALAMDPQQRLLLETSWEALEGAGIEPGGLRGSSTGVFAGLMITDYAAGGAALSGAGLEGFGAGIAGSVASGRIAYTLGLEGPAVTIDTACSSSLVAMHLAAQALRSGECELALAGGATVMSTSGLFTEFSRQRVLSPNGRCKSFAASADGTAWGEGCGMVLLERLSDARANNRRILAVLRGSATNQDGASNGLTAPNGPSQERVIRQALANAGLKPSGVDAVEAHGTGTILGDPIEAQALLATYGQDREDGPLALGSLKSNFGHTQAAAGVGGVIKMVMALREEALPETLHVDEPTPHVDWESGEIELLTQRREWKQGNRPRRAGISSFGISGTNAHLILEEAPRQELPAGAGADRPPAIPWALSAKTPEALREYAGRLAAHVEKAGPDPIDVAHSLLSSRAALPHRSVVVGASVEELLAGLDALVQEKPAANLAEAKTLHGKTAFLFSGQGCQRAEMGKELYEAFPVYAKAFDEACEALEQELGQTVKEAVFAAEGSEPSASLGSTDMTQASLFAVEVALYELLTSFGVKPDYLIGHSIGEIAAARVAGVLSLEDAAKLVAARGRLMAALPAGGAMASVRATEDEVTESLEPYVGRLAIAAVNAPSSIVVSGDADALGEWEAEQAEAGRKTKRLDVSHAFHSHRMEPMLAEFEQLAGGLDFSAPEIPIASNLSGEELSEEQATSPAYWVSHVREAVRFAAGIEFLKAQGTARFLELGPDAILTAIAAECVEDEGAAFASTMRRGHSEPTSFVTSLGVLQASGAKLDLSSLTRGSHTELPTYPFQRERFWLEVDLSQGDPISFGQSATEHPLLGASVVLAGGRTRVFTGRISQKDPAWIAQHTVLGTVILPGTALVELALRAGREIGAERLEELVLEAPLPVPEGAVQLQVTATRDEEDPQRFELSIHSRAEAGEELGDEGAWARHATGVLSTHAKAPAFDFGSTWPPAGAEEIDTSMFYDVASEMGVDLGPAFQGVETVWKLGEEIFAEVSLAEEQHAEAERCDIHPALLDAAAQASLMAADVSDYEQGVRLPFAWSGVDVQRDVVATRLRLRARVEGQAFSIEAADPAGVPVCSVEGLHARPLDPANLPGASGAAESLYEIAWTRVAPPAPAEPSEVELLSPPALDSGADSARAAHELADWGLQRLQAAIEEGPGRRFAFLSVGAVSLSDQESPDPSVAALWGLVRSAQAEHPGRFLLIDSDGSEASEAALEAALSLEGEPQIALRDGDVLVPRMTPVADADEEEEAPPLDPEGTVLVTGGLSGLGSIVARHLAGAHGVTRLLLASRRGPEAPGASEQLAELAELGCEARAIACDVGDRAQLEGLLAAIPAEHPLVGVVHCAGVLDDGPIEALDRERVDRVLAPKADAAWHLHELTKEHELGAFVLYSSVASTLGTPGQGNYAAANAFLDALAQSRRAEGLVATSIAWGLWEEQTELTAALGDDERTRLSRVGLTAMAPEAGLELFDRARRSAKPLAVAIPLEGRALKRLARAELLPPILSGLVQAPARRSRAVPGSLVRRLATVPEAEREGVVLEVVREHVAITLGHSSAGEVDVDRTLLELGMDSLGAVELRNRLVAVAGVQIPPTAAFEHPTTAALAVYLSTLLAEQGTSVDGSQAAPALGGGTLRSLFVGAHRDGRTLEVARLLVDASQLRPAFESPDELDALPHQIPISREGSGPRLLCVPSFLAGSGPHQFARIGQALDGRRRMTALALPGHGSDERLPASWDAAMDTLARSALQAAEGEPFVLLGYSSGGAVAHALGERFERDGEQLVGTAMIDSYLPDTDGLVELFGSTMGQLLEIDHEALVIDDDQLIAMGAYLRFMPDWTPGSLNAPGLMLRASEGLATMRPASAELPAWQSPQATVEVDGNHFSLIAEDAGATAEAIDGWLSEQFEAETVAEQGR